VKQFWRVILAFFVLVVGFLCWKAYTAGLDYQAAAEVQIAVPAEVVFPLVSRLEHWTTWSPFASPSADDVQLDEDPAGPRLVWQDPRGGTAVLTLHAIDAQAGTVQHELESSLFPPMQGQIEVSAIDPQSCTVRWTAQGRVPNTIFYRLLSENYGQGLSFQLQHALDRLKNILEGERELEPAAADANPPGLPQS